MRDELNLETTMLLSSITVSTTSLTDTPLMGVKQDLAAVVR
ncbi:hypothetical protein [Paenibacillus polymyxa]|nr:hypothetical protein [Paenibacillus polymyxa]